MRIEAEPLPLPWESSRSGKLWEAYCDANEGALVAAEVKPNRLRDDTTLRCTVHVSQCGRKAFQYEEVGDDLDVLKQRCEAFAGLFVAALGLMVGEKAESLEWRQASLGTWIADGEGALRWSAFIQQGEDSGRWIGYLRVSSSVGVSSLSFSKETLAEAQRETAYRLHLLREALEVTPK